MFGFQVDKNNTVTGPGLAGVGMNFQSALEAQAMIQIFRAIYEQGKKDGYTNATRPQWGDDT